MIRTLNSESLNKIANNLEVRPYLGGIGKLDLTEIVSNPFNFCFMTDTQTGAHIFINKGSGFYETHTLSLPEARGREMLRLMQDARTFMFLNTDCAELSTFVPEDQTATYLWAIKAGFRELFKRENCFNLNGKQVGGSYLNLTYDDWVLKDKLNLKVGNSFKNHLKLDNQNLSDAAWAGATVRGCIAGTASKVISYYNKWTLRTALAPIRIVSLTPFVIDMFEAVLQLNAGQFSILKVKDECLLQPQFLQLLEGPQA